jgi:beta-galactosidase
MKSLRFSPGFVFAILSLAALVFSVPSFAAEQRTVVNLDNGWHFKQASGLMRVESSSFDDADWSRVDVPHTWNRIGNQGTERSPNTNAVQGIGWYRLHFKTPASAAGRRAFLQFDGVGEIAQVWLNGHYLGKHEGAFSRFRFDATAALKQSGDNLLVVQADNSKPAPSSTTENIIPLSGDFFIFGGIYRSVSLILTNPVHVDMMDYGGPGVYAHVIGIDHASARVQVTGRLVNSGRAPKQVIVETIIEDVTGKTVARTLSRPISLTSKVDVFHTELRVAHPRLWQGAKDPYLYRIGLILRLPEGVVLDRVVQPLGLRIMRFDPDKGFFLNGEHLFLMGASRHQDRPIKGWAISSADIAQDFDIMADMGANTVRLAHYQHDQEAYEQADAHGFVVWAEIPLVNQVSFDGGPPSPALKANARQQLTELIRQNYNHPSIAVWSIANEIDLRPTQGKGPSKPGALLKELNLLAKSEDPDRATTFADCCEVGLPPHVGSAIANIQPRDIIVGTADTVGYNRYFGWYVGIASDFGPMLDHAHALRPKLPIAVSEYGAGGSLTQHTDNPAGGLINSHGRPHPEEYEDTFHEMSWETLKARPYLWGVYIWNMFDFSSVSRNEGDQTDINDKGMVSYDRKTRKDVFYFYRANWSSKPTLHLVGSRYVDRPYGVVDIKAYSNAAQARLSLNGADLGTTPCEDGVCLWKAVHLVSGANNLQATANIGGIAMSDALHLVYSGSPAIVRIKAGDLTGYDTTDGQRYGSDNYFSSGEPHGINPQDTPADERIATAAADAPLYDSYREGDFTYCVPVPNGRYRVVLKFVEPSANAAGARVFDVNVNGVRTLKDFDVFSAAGGKLKGIDRSFETAVKDGTIVIAFRASKGNALLSALSITPLGH